MGQDHQKIYHRAWSQLGPPLRPPPETIVAFREQLKDVHGRTLLLGVTPELAEAVPDLIAIDRNYSMVANVWPGNTPTRFAFVADWRRANFKSDTFSICLGDGSLSFLTFPREAVALFLELNRIVKAGGRAVFRVYLAPDIAEKTTALRDEVLSGKIRNFHAFKLRLAMALAARQSVPQIRVAEILIAFNSLFGNRQDLVRATGWNRKQIDTVDFYKDSEVVYTFAKQDQLLAAVSKVCPDPRLITSGNYEMSEHCPLLLVNRT
jgi:SAM-dependent methyltransferase